MAETVSENKLMHFLNMGSEVVLLSVALLTVVALELFYRCRRVNLHVFGQVTVLCESSPTHYTYKWLFACVGAQVIKQIPSLRKGPTAPTECAPESSLLPIYKFRNKQVDSQRTIQTCTDYFTS